MPFRDVTVGALLTCLAEAHPDREALVYSHAGLRWTFRQLDDEARLVARGLAAHGVGRGDRVAVWATNVPEWIVLQFALAKLGAILVTVNTSLRAAEIEYLLKQNETSTLVTIRGFRGVDYLEELRQIGAVGDASLRVQRFPHLQRVIYIGDDAPDGVVPYTHVREAGQASHADIDAMERAVALDDVINMQYTSGTTCRRANAASCGHAATS
jgi:fatty-acyl-CoA synthase